MSTAELDLMYRSGSSSRSGDLACLCSLHYVVGMATGVTFSLYIE
jgi:hypothetical protein